MIPYGLNLIEIEKWYIFIFLTLEISTGVLDVEDTTLQNYNSVVLSIMWHISRLLTSILFSFLFSLLSYLIMILQPHVDFGLKLLGADAMAIPGLYGFVQVALLTFTEVKL